MKTMLVACLLCVLSVSLAWGEVTPEDWRAIRELIQTHVEGLEKRLDFHKNLNYVLFACFGALVCILQYIFWSKYVLERRDERERT